MCELCTDNRFELIEKYKAKLIEATNIETDTLDMAAIDSILFRFWQMGWLDKLDADTVPVMRCKDCMRREEDGMCEYKVAWAAPQDDYDFCSWWQRRK